MMKLSDTARKMAGVVCVLAAVFIIASAVFYRSFAFLPFAFGVLLGGGVNLVKIILLNRIVERTIAMDVSVTVRSFYGQYFLRFFLTIGVFVVATQVPVISFWGVAAGVITFPLSAYSMSFLKPRD